MRFLRGKGASDLRAGSVWFIAFVKVNPMSYYESLFFAYRVNRIQEQLKFVFS